MYFYLLDQPRTEEIDSFILKWTRCYQSVDENVISVAHYYLSVYQFGMLRSLLSTLTRLDKRTRCVNTWKLTFLRNGSLIKLRWRQNTGHESWHVYFQNEALLMPPQIGLLKQIISNIDNNKDQQLDKTNTTDKFNTRHNKFQLRGEVLVK